MSETKNIPIPLVNYVNLIRERKSPYYEIVEFLMKDMEMHFYKTGQPFVMYAITPSVIQGEIEKKVTDDKLTSVNVCRTVLALLQGAKLDEDKDYFVTTTTSGKRNYHVNVNPQTLTKMSRML
jgi:regulator of PEP synthase PpsR (kinase-PPPase family)